MPKQIIKCNRENCGDRGKYPVCYSYTFSHCNLLNRRGVYNSCGVFASQIPIIEFEIRGVRR